MDLLTPDLGLFIWTLLAFLIVFFILKKFAWGPILKTLGDRERGIADAIAAADRVRVEMAQMQNESEKLMVQTREERSIMLKEAKDMKDRIVAEAKEQAKAEANKIIIDAQQQINQQKAAAMADVKNQIGLLSVEVAEKILRQQLSTADSQNAYNSLLAQEVKLN
jgi:F-type H+-transporting ATPase subunit b